MGEALQKSICPDCFGSGFESVAGMGVRRCRCVESQRVAKALASANIPARFSGASFDSYEASSPNLQRALEQSRRFVSEYSSGSGLGLLWVGNPGVGKTHLAVSVLRALILRGHTGLFYDFRDLLKEIQDSYNPEKQSSELDVLKPILQAEILVLDELGAARPTEWVETTATHILNRRYNERLTTIFTTNYLDAGMGTVSGETLTDRIGPRVRSRLHEMTSLILTDASDYREVIRMRRSRRVK